MSATRVPAAKLRGPFKALLEKLKVVDFDHVKYSKATETGLNPSTHYRYGKSGVGKPRYEYVTDEKGRIRSAYTDDLKLKPEGQKRGSHNAKTPGKLDGDDAGHLFADQFDGAGGKGNLVSQLSELNQGAWKNMETEWADALRSGKHVEVRIDVGYGDGVRPTDFKVEYAIDGGKTITRRFLN